MTRGGDAGAGGDPGRAERGMAVRREVLGDAHVDRAVAATTEFTAPFQDLITRYAWGEIWSRPGLTRAERSMITLTALAALRNGLSPAQVCEVLLQVAIYAGVPAANRAFAVAQGVLTEEGGPAGRGAPASGAADGQGTP